MSALFEVGKNKIGIDEIKESLRTHQEDKLGPVAPANGLYLKNVTYKQR